MDLPWLLHCWVHAGLSVYVHVLLQQQNDYVQLLEAYNASQQSLQQSASTISVSATASLLFLDNLWRVDSWTWTCDCWSSLTSVDVLNIARSEILHCMQLHIHHSEEKWNVTMHIKILYVFHTFIEVAIDSNTGHTRKSPSLKNLANFSRTTERYDIKFYIVVTHSRIHKPEKFHYIICWIDRITLLLVVAIQQLGRYQKLFQLFKTAQTLEVWTLFK